MNPTQQLEQKGESDTQSLTDSDNVNTVKSMALSKLKSEHF